MSPSPATVPSRLQPLAAAVRARRRELGLRQRELAELAGVSERFVHMVEAGKPTVQLDKLLDLLETLGLHLELHSGGASQVADRRMAKP